MPYRYLNPCFKMIFRKFRLIEIKFVKPKIGSKFGLDFYHKLEFIKLMFKK